MLVFGTCTGTSGNYETLARPSIERVRGGDDLVLSAPGVDGICAVYNRFIDTALSHPGCEGLVLLHDDVEILDANFRAKALHAVRTPGAGVAGVVGGAGISGLSWWNARRTAGSVLETRGFVDLGDDRAPVDVVDGLLMVVSREAFSGTRFDRAAFPHFHGYDADYCLSVNDRGLRVEVIPLEVVHHTKGGYGDRARFDAADAMLRAKWPQFVRPLERREQARRLLRTGFASSRKRASVARQIARDLQSRAQSQLDRRRAGEGSGPVGADAGELDDVAADPSARCPVCDAEPDDRPVNRGLDATVLVCASCGTGVTWPPPGRDAAGEGIWLEQYGNRRLARREVWHREARVRIEWTQLFAPEGSLVEVGCGTGEYVLAAAQAGFEAYGVEVSEWAAQKGRDLGVEITTGTFEDWTRQYPGFRPDVVALWHVLEHVREPLALLQNVFAALRDNGVLLMEVPNFASSEAELLGVQWSEAQPSDHVFHFTASSLALLVERAGFDIEHLLPITRRPYSTVQSWRAQKQATLLARRPWPSDEFVRLVARRPAKGDL